MWIKRWNELLFGPPVLRRDGYPDTLRAEQSNLSLDRPVAFEPALVQFPRAFRAGEPQFHDEEIGHQWYQCRYQVLAFILQTIAESEYSDHLLLRGSAVMWAWFEDLARCPGDLDFVTVPHRWRSDDRRSQNMVQSVVETLQGKRAVSDIVIPNRHFAMEEIWVYEKAPGLRVIVPWQHDDVAILNGTVQLDFVFGERVPDAPVSTEIQFPGSSPVSVVTASRAQSLAWKLLWLCTDCYANGKDLYDAVLLAESGGLSRDLLEQTFGLAITDMTNPMTQFSIQSFQQLNVQWSAFQQEYPWVDGTEQSWMDRLLQAIRPLF